jgi:DNA-directed RNA polymerase subunit RPC12/RpoP
MWYADGKKKQDIRNDILEFLRKYAPDLSLPRWEPAIDRQIKLLDRYPLIEINSIEITQKELDTIATLDGRMHRRLAFTLLCIAKFKNAVNSKNNDWASRNDKETFRMANIQKNVVVQSALFRDLRDAGLLQFSKIVDNLNVRVLFIDKGGDPVRIVDDFRNLGNQIHAFEGEPYVKCQECGLWVHQNKWSNRKYCRTCEKYKPIEKKTITCVDCGVDFDVSGIVKKQIRCQACRNEKQKDWQRKSMQKKRKCEVS